MRTGKHVPRICEFYGIVIEMYYKDHAVPHFHARYAEHKAKVSIATGDVIAGKLPVRVARLVREWAHLRRRELVAVWELARSHRPLTRIEPLD